MRREMFGARSSDALTRTRYEHKLLLREEEALALEIAVADRLALKLFPCGETTRIVTLYLDRPDGLLSRHALEGRGVHLRVRVKGFFPAPPTPAGNELPAIPLPAVYAVLAPAVETPGAHEPSAATVASGNQRVGPGRLFDTSGETGASATGAGAEGLPPDGPDRLLDTAGENGAAAAPLLAGHPGIRAGAPRRAHEAAGGEGLAEAMHLPDGHGRPGRRRPSHGNGVPDGDPAALASLAAPPAPSTPGLAVEVKRRRGSLTRKDRTWCLPAELPALLAGEDPRARRLGLHRLVPGARPSCLVGYLRRVYEDPSGTLRVTIDRQLGTVPGGPAEVARLVAGLPPEVPPAPDAPVVAEIKHLGPLPGWIVGTVGRAEAHFSKLVWALVKRGGG
jgi:hypothetical protein